MKRIFTLIAVFLSMLSVNAQPDAMLDRRSNSSGKLSISTMVNSPMKVTVDGKTYTNRDNDEIIISNLKPGYHAVKIYRQSKIKNNGWRDNKQLLYQSNIYVKAQYHVDITINRFGKAFVDESPVSTVYYDDEDDNGGWNNNIDQVMNGRAFDQFKQTIRNEGFDNTKLVLAKQTIAENYFTTAQVKEMVQLFSFENSKLDLAKFCYEYTVDRNNYFVLNDAFSFSSSKEELARYIQAYR